MTKRSSEPFFGASLGEVDLSLVIFKPPDDARNRKPCDYMVWLSPNGTGVWFEVKDTDAVNTFSLRELRPAQIAGIRNAARMGIPYFLAVYWRRHRHWTISDAVKLVRWWDEGNFPSISRELLMSRYGVDSTPGQLPSILHDVLTGDV